MSKYWIFSGQHPDGPYDISELTALPDFNEKTMVCPVGECHWSPAKDVIEFCEVLGIAPPKKARSTLKAYSPPSKRFEIGTSSRTVASGDIIGPDFQLQARRSFTKQRGGSTSHRPARPSIDWKAPPQPRVRLFRTVLVAVVLLMLYPERAVLRIQAAHLRTNIVNLLETATRQPKGLSLAHRK
jgi:hypothetical protein